MTKPRCEVCGSDHLTTDRPIGDVEFRTLCFSCWRDRARRKMDGARDAARRWDREHPPRKAKQ